MGLISRRPHSPPDIGGVAAPSRKRCEATAAAQTGVVGSAEVLRNAFFRRVVPFSTTRSAPLKEASRLLLDVASTPLVSPMSRVLQNVEIVCRRGL
jgi:hypothetical protein